MGDYTPTTDGVRDTYVRAHRSDGVRAEFDRWLAEHDREVIRKFINDEIDYVRNGEKHSDHCDDIGCLGCECDPECDDYVRNSEKYLASEFSDKEPLSEFADIDAAADKLHCEAHKWFLEEGEQCPVCEGVGLERERIINLLDDYTMYRFEKQWFIDMIKETE